MSTTEGASAERAAPTAPRGRGKQPKHQKVTFLTQRLDYLFETVHPKHRGPYSYQEVADAILEEAGPDPDGKAPISPSYIWHLRSGLKDNPTRRHIALLAAFFGVSPIYFFEGEHDLTVDQIELDRILKDPKVHALARAAVGLSDTSLDTVQSLVQSLAAASLSDTSLDAVQSLIQSLHKVEREAREGHSADQ